MQNKSRVLDFSKTESLISVQQAFLQCFDIAGQMPKTLPLQPRDFLFHLCIYSDLLESIKGTILLAIMQAFMMCFPDLLPELPRYCCPVQIFMGI